MIYYYRGEYRKDVIGLDIESPAFKFGAGFFETIYYNGREICHLRKHSNRIHRSLANYHLSYHAVDLEQVILTLLERNNLLSFSARVNVYYLLDQNDSKCSPMVTVQPYTLTPNKSYRLKITQYVHESHLAAHKSMNYLHYFLARREAIHAGYDDALLVNASGLVLESSTASILFSDGKTLIEPESANRLPGIAIELARNTVDIVPRRIAARDLAHYRHAYVLNSLIGMKPVAQIDDVSFSSDHAACELVSDRVLLEGSAISLD